jgi:hypothetical protein
MRIWGKSIGAALAWFTVVGVLAAPVGAGAADSNWVGTWKLDKSKSDFTGDTMSYSRTASGMYHFSDGTVTNYDFNVDGKEYRMDSGHRATWVPAGDHAWDVTIKTTGDYVIKVHRELSDGDKTLTATATGTKPDGSMFNEQAVYTRVTGTTGLVGKWRSIKATEGAPEKFVVTAPSAGVLHWEIPDYKESTEGKMDGTDHPIKGPDVPPGMTFGGKLETPARLAYVLKQDGKPIQFGVQTMSGDGTSFTDVSYNPGKKDEKATAVYLKQ